MRHHHANYIAMKSIAKSRRELHTAPELPTAPKETTKETIKEIPKCQRCQEGTPPWTNWPKIGFWPAVIFMCLCSKHAIIAFLFAAALYSPYALIRSISVFLLVFGMLTIVQIIGRTLWSMYKRDKGKPLQQTKKNVVMPVKKPGLTLRPAVETSK